MRYVAIVVMLVAFKAVGQEPDWKPLFNGRDHAGWQVLAGDWSVENGELTGRAKDVHMAWIRTESEFADAEVELEFRTPTPANGGLQFRAHWLPKEPALGNVAPDQLPREMYGYQVNVDTQRDLATGAVMAKHGVPPLALASSDAQATVKPTEWNALRVRFSGDDIETYVNGALACRVQSDRFQRGFLALQVTRNETGGQGEVHYRNLRVRDLGYTGPWQPLFNGKDLSGWKTWGAETWGVEDGTIVGRSGPKKSEGYLATETSYQDFDVRGQFRMLGAGNFGLFYHSTIEYDDKEYPVISGLQGEVAPEYPGPTGWVYESYKRGWLIQPDPTSAAAFALRPGLWNEIRIRSIGSRIQTWVNGFPVLDLVDPAPQLHEGAFALQLHTGGVDGIAWKDLFVRVPQP